MSVSAISSTTNVYQNQLQQIRKDFSTLQTDLSSGSLATAQQAYAALTQDLQAVQQTDGGQQTGGSSQLSNDLAAVGSALQSGNVTSAQSAFATLMQDLGNSNTQSTTGTSGSSTLLQAVGGNVNIAV